MEEVLNQGQGWQDLVQFNGRVPFLGKPVSSAFNCETSSVLERK